MEPPNPSFADEFNVPQQIAVLIFDELRATVSLPLQVHRLEVLIKSRLIAFPDACFEFADVGLEEAQHSSLANLLEVGSCQPSSRPFEECCCWDLRGGSSSPPLSVAMLRSCRSLPSSQYISQLEIGRPNLECFSSNFITSVKQLLAVGPSSDQYDRAQQCVYTFENIVHIK